MAFVFSRTQPLVAAIMSTDARLVKFATATVLVLLKCALLRLVPRWALLAQLVSLVARMAFVFNRRPTTAAVRTIQWVAHKERLA